MGWYFQAGRGSHRDVDRECNDSNTIACSLVNFSHHWSVWKGAESNVIVFDLISRLPHANEWGYKPMGESAFPYFYDCPLKFLDMAPVANAEWREEVKKYWQRVSEKSARTRMRKLEHVRYVGR